LDNAESALCTGGGFAVDRTPGEERVLRAGVSLATVVFADGSVTVAEAASVGLESSLAFAIVAVKGSSRRSGIASTI
jgi:hypothetical protein